MANAEHVALLKQGVRVWNEWRQENRWQTPDLVGAYFRSSGVSGANLRGVDLHHADLRGVDLRGANLSTADLRQARLAEANLWGADLREAVLKGADLSAANVSEAVLNAANLTVANLGGANLLDVVLVGANLTGADLRKANMTGAALGDTVFANTNLRNVTGLERCRHDAPSSIDHRTFAISGSLPLAFLRGCGLPDQLIDYLPSLLNAAIQFYSCFISYSTADQAFANRLHADLQNRGVRCWFAPHDIQGGKKVHEQIDEAIRVYDKLLLILSDHSMNSN